MKQTHTFLQSMLPKSSEYSNNQNDPAPNLKAKVSDENLNVIEEIKEDEKAPEQPVNFQNQRKRSIVSLPEEVESEDQFLFLRLRKQIKGHWNKLIERYPNGNLFHRTSQAEQKSAESTNSDNIENPENPSEIVRTDSVRSSASIDDETGIVGSQVKSLFLLPAFSCKRDDEGRRVVPFISSLLEVKYSTLSLCTYLFRLVWKQKLEMEWVSFSAQILFLK